MTISFKKDRELDIIAIGRACIDLNANEYNRPMEETKTFTKYVGGSPANIAIGSSKLGLKSGFIGKISKDQHGNYIKQYMESCGVDTSNIVYDTEGRKTGLAFTEILSPEECSILMYRDNVADLYLEASEIDEEYIKKAKILLVSGTALSKSPSREAVLKAIRMARDNDVKVIFEIDYRPYTWESKEETSIYYTLVASLSDIVIGTREEFDIVENLTGVGSNEKTVKNMFEQGVELVVIKHGVEGSYVYEPNGSVYHGKVYKTKELKTFGAGDSFAAAFIYAIVNGKSYDTALKYGSASASIVVSSHSSSEAIPTVAEIEKLINERE